MLSILSSIKKHVSQFFMKCFSYLLVSLVMSIFTKVLLKAQQRALADDAKKKDSDRQKQASNALSALPYAPNNPTSKTTPQTTRSDKANDAP